MKFLFILPLCLFLCRMSAAQSHLSGASFIAFRLLPGQDLKEELENKAREQGWKAAAVVSAVGSLQSAKIRFANQKEASTVAGSLEILSLSGTLSSNGCHLHLSVADAQGKTTGGHLMPGCPVYTTAEIVVAVLEDLVFERETDSTYGFRELKVKSAQKPDRK